MGHDDGHIDDPGALRKLRILLTTFTHTLPHEQQEMLERAMPWLVLCMIPLFACLVAQCVSCCYPKPRMM